MGRRNKSGFGFSVGYGWWLKRWCVCMLRVKQERTFSDRSRLCYRDQICQTQRAFCFSDQTISERNRENKAKNPNKGQAFTSIYYPPEFFHDLKDFLLTFIPYLHAYESRLIFHKSRVGEERQNLVFSGMNPIVQV